MPKKKAAASSASTKCPIPTSSNNPFPSKRSSENLIHQVFRRPFRIWNTKKRIQ
ncbi:hypothetical protein [Neisseria sicca]|uniref:hypothetical protein n=1 Tax=Neisseria sicca TaxID=490 RepID=UPI001649B601|nr:hypothetical protein [Neisseria sicca]